jgi:hypothetical protein
VKLAISIHEDRGESAPVAVVVPDEATEPQMMQACAVAGCVAWEIRDGQQFGRYVIRIEEAPSADVTSDEVPG